jgi:hypothetical protein
MKHQEIEQLKTVARVDELYPHPAMSRIDRLERWADLLERNPRQFLSTLHQTEYQPARERAAMRCDSSPLSVAFRDPVLRAAGLADDSYGEARRFFELSDHQLHDIVCYCHFGETVSSATAARYVRAMAHGKRQGFMTRLFAMFAR